MKTYNKKILLSVTGMSPAVVTETLYALITEKGFIPTEIRVITTLRGKRLLLEKLLGIENGKKKNAGALAEFIQDYGEQYGFSEIHFDESCIEVIEDKDHQKLEDIRSPEENSLASDQIVRLVAELCQDDNAALHVSIAGGRKTMGFFLGYALSLYGREQDSLSHVLVSEGFENQDSFFYPKPYSYIITGKDGKPLDAKEGKVMLAEIPWVRLNLGVPEGLLQNTISYSDSVQKAQNLLADPKITFLSPIDDRKVQFGETVIKLAPKAYGFLLSVVLNKICERNLDNEQLFKTYFLPIYQGIKAGSRLEMRFKYSSDYSDYKEEVRDILAEARDILAKKIKAEFSINRTDIPYIPSSSYGRFELLVDLERISVKEIETDLKHILD
ncbi:CRISPR-associated ring nuclease Csm6 [Avibacterium paragallinarum]|uniref:CRISPR-associated ring nuclease Csm6 n=1 Tax=Avibacterium paragallinarum TaxID=728 RepID=UPI002EDB5153